MMFYAPSKEAIGVLAGRIAGMLAQLILTAHLFPLFSVEDFAKWTLFSSTIFLVGLLDFGIETALVPQLARTKAMHQFWGVFHRAGIYFLLPALFVPLIAKVMLIRTWLLIARAGFKGFHESHIVGWIECLGWIITIAILWPQRSYENICHVYLICFLLTPVLTWIYLVWKRGWQWAFAKELPKHSLTLWLLQLGLIAFWASQPFIVAHFFSPRDVAEFGIWQKLFNLIVVVVSAYMVPFWAHFAVDQSGFQKVLIRVIGFSLIAGIILLSCGPWITELWLHARMSMTWGYVLFLTSVTISIFHGLLPRSMYQKAPK